MAPESLILLIFTVVVIWGGLVASVVALRTLPTPETQEVTETVGVGTSEGYLGDTESEATTAE